MTIIPTLRCRSMRQSLAFYTGVLPFVKVADQAPSPLTGRGWPKAG